jgi:hypothetical protein
MNLPIKKAGQYTLDEFNVYRLNEPEQFVDIKFLIHKWEITESMQNGYMHGSAVIYDGVGLFYDFLKRGLRGEEELYLKYRDWYDQEAEYYMFLYSITDFKTQIGANETLNTYTIHFISKDKFLTERTMVRKSFTNGQIGDYVQSVFDEYYLSENPDTKQIEIKQTDGEQDLVVPNYSPEQTMHFFARKAYSADNQTQTFRFFENKERYNFTTHEELAWDVLEAGEEINFYFKINQADQSPDGQIILMQNIIDIDFPSTFNTISEMVDGDFYKSTTEVDIFNRTLMRTEYRYLDEYQDYLLPDYISTGQTRNIHSKEFVDDNMNYLRDTLVVKDYPAVGVTQNDLYVRPHTFYSDIYNKKIPNFNHHSKNFVTMRVYGRNQVMAGKFVQIEILKADSNVSERKIDEQRSGIYLVESCRNVFYENEYIQVLSMSKSGIKGQPEPANDYNREPQIIVTGR